VSGRTKKVAHRGGIGVASKLPRSSAYRAFGRRLRASVVARCRKSSVHRMRSAKRAANRGVPRNTARVRWVHRPTLPISAGSGRRERQAGRLPVQLPQIVNQRAGRDSSDNDDRATRKPRPRCSKAVAWQLAPKLCLQEHSGRRDVRRRMRKVNPWMDRSVGIAPQWARKEGRGRPCHGPEPLMNRSTRSLLLISE
jgi:hypothetical protein